MTSKHTFMCCIMYCTLAQYNEVKNRLVQTAKQVLRNKSDFKIKKFQIYF